MNKTVQQQEKAMADLKKQKPKMFGRNEWEKISVPLKDNLRSYRKNVLNV